MLHHMGATRVAAGARSSGVVCDTGVVHVFGNSDHGETGTGLAPALPLPVVCSAAAADDLRVRPSALSCG